MRRRRHRKQTAAVSLFPFLAVLICTMGALIVLLVLGVQQAHVHATQVKQQLAGDRDAARKAIEARRMAAEDEQWKFDVLLPQRDEHRQWLADERLKLGHLEQHIRELTEQWKGLQAELSQLQSGQTPAGAEAARRAELEQQVAAARAALEEAQAKLKQKPRSFSIVPYEGPNGTHRRPIFVECTQRGIILQPEGIRLEEKDFDGPLGPGNPLATALRTTRDYWVQSGVALDGEPYPLLIVRPGGALAYSVARAAMKSWEDEFGYELVDDSMQLSFPPTDPHLSQLLQQAVQVARQRQVMLAAASPRLYRDALERSGRASFVPDRQTGPTSRGSAGNGGLGAGHDQRFDIGRTRLGRVENGEFQSRDRQPEDSRTEGIEGGVAGATAGREAGGGRGGRGRGDNWGLPNLGNIAVTRQVRVVCQANQLVVVPGAGESLPPRTVPLSGPLERHVDTFIDELWKYMEHWGIAIPGGYWKPVLVVDVQPGGELRFRELEQALRTSGLEIQRKTR